MEQISENLFMHRDTCNVYVIRSGREAVLIDFGAGRVLEQLKSIGVERVTDVLMTHHHRDQGQGLPRAVGEGIRVWVPHMERDLFQDAGGHWQGRGIFNNYNVRQDRFSLLESVRVEGTLRDHAKCRFGSVSFTVVPTPGHTVGSISLLADIDGRAIAFTGDLIYAPGKVWSLAATQWTYNGAEGVGESLLSLQDLRALRPDMLLPSHGDPITEAEPAIDLLAERLQQLLKSRGQRAYFLQQRDHDAFETITPHLLRNKISMARSYVLLSDSGKALVIDYGYDHFLGLPGGVDRSSRRPRLSAIRTLKQKYNVRQIDVAIATHYHDDHVAGFNLLREAEGAQMWAAENFADILEHPSHYDLPCLWYDPIHVDRVLPLEQPIVWEEYELTLYAQPGHTYYAVAIAFEVDGRRVVAIGDQQDDKGDLWNYVYKNRFRLQDYRESAELYLRLKPDVIISGHWNPVWIEKGYLEELYARGTALEQAHKDLLPLDQADFGAEGFGAWIRPYQSEIQSGSSVSLQVEILNPFARRETATIRFIVPEGWRAEREQLSLELDAHAGGFVDCQIFAPLGLQVRRARVAVDITIGEHEFGQQADALITVGGEGGQPGKGGA